jgi:hypothetical protein
MSDPGRKSEILEREPSRKVGNSGSDIQLIRGCAVGYQFYVREPELIGCLTRLPVSLYSSISDFLMLGGR